MEKMALPLLVISRTGTVMGKTRMQKLVYLTQKAANGSVFPYQNYMHGPFSVELSKAVDELRGVGLVDEKVTTTSKGYQLHTYELTSEGKQLLKTILSSWKDGERWDAAVRDVVKRFRKVKMEVILKEAYRQAGLRWTGT